MTPQLPPSRRAARPRYQPRPQGRRSESIPVFGQSTSLPVYVQRGQLAPIYARHAKAVGRPAPPALLRPSRRVPASRALRWALGTMTTLGVCAGLMVTGAPGYVTASQRIGQSTAPADTAAPYLAYDPGTTATAAPVAATQLPAQPGAASAPLESSAASGLAADGIPQTALAAYQNAAARELAVNPTCGLTWPLLAGIGRVESDHGRFAGAVLHTDGVSTPKIIGIPLDGDGNTLVLDTDQGRLDGDTVYDRAVGPMQFIPSTWAEYAVDANADGVADPFNIFDEAAAAAAYLCDAGKDLTNLAGQTRAIRTYNDNDDYIRLVLKLEGIYATGVPGLTVPVLADSSAAPSGHPDLPPANPGTPLSATSPLPPTTAATPAKPATSTPATGGSPGSGGSPSVSIPPAQPAPPAQPPSSPAAPAGSTPPSTPRPTSTPAPPSSSSNPPSAVPAPPPSPGTSTSTWSDPATPATP